MADVKFTGLSAASVIPNNGSVMAISTYDGVSTYTSEKYTMSQLKDIVYVMEAEDEIVANSSGTNKTVFSDSNSGFRIELDTYGAGESIISFDGNGSTSDFSRGWIYEDSTQLVFGFGQDGGGLAGTNFTANLDKIVSWVSNREWLSVKENTGANSVGNTDMYSAIISSRNSTVNAGIVNSVVLGGNGITANASDTAFVDNFSQVGTNLGFYGTTPIAKPTSVAVSAAGIHAALVSLGLIS